MLTACQTLCCPGLGCTQDTSVSEGSQTVWRTQRLAQKVGDLAPERMVEWCSQGLAVTVGD